MSQIGALQKQVNALNAAGGAGGNSMAAGLTAAAGSGSSAWQRLSNDISKSWASIRSTWATGTNQMRRTIQSLETQGQGLRRAGQQIMFGFTLPFALGVGAATKWALDNEKAMTRLQKVYGDFSYSGDRVKKETAGIGEALQSLSGIMGLNQQETITIASEWAAVGLAGADLLNATRATTEAMVLGDLDAEQATKSLISIMAVWRTNTDPVIGSVNDRFSELTDTLAILNATENATGAQFDDLVDTLQRASGVARQYGLDMRETVALAATLIPSTGTGAQAGNAIKTILSRVMVPTKEAAKELTQIGVDLESQEWINANALQKLQLMGQAFVDLNEAAKNEVVADLAGRWQINRFAVMMEDLASGELMFKKGLDATLDPVRRQTTYMKELSTVLESNPKKFEILTNVMKNDFADTMIQLMPVIIGFMSLIQQVFERFNALAPSTKTWIFTLLALVAILGPILMLLGVFVTTGANVLKMFRFGSGVVQVFWKVLMNLGTAIGFVTRALSIMVYAIGKGLATAVSAALGLVAKLATALVGLAGRFLTVALNAAFAAGAMIASFARTVASAIASAAATGLAWLVSAAGAMLTAALNIAFAAGSMIASFVATAAAAVASAGAVILAWGGAVVSALAATASAVVAAVAAIGIPLWVIVAIVLAVVVAVVAIFNEDFRDGIGNAVRTVIEWFGKLPEAINNTMRAVAETIWGWMTGIVDALSYLNPFQRHSPSLVDNVKAGVSTILDEYSRLRGIGAHVLNAARAHEAFQNAIAGTKGAFDAAETAKDRADIASQAPQALPAFDAMVSARAVLQQDLIPLGQEIAKQSLLVAKLTAEYDKLDAQLRTEQRTLDLLQRELDAVNDAIDRSEDAIDKYTSAGITGMRAVEDAVFANTLAQKQLKLAIMDLEDAGGVIEDLQSRMQGLNAEMEMLTGERQGLYLAGAGSDILQTYDDQISLIEQQQAALEGTSSELAQMNKELEELARQAERMELERWITFEPQLRQIDQLAEGLNELPFEEIIAGIEKENALLAKLRPEQDRLNRAVAAQQVIVDVLTYKLEDLKYQLEAQEDILDRLNAAYSDIEALIAEMTSEMNDFANAAKSATDEAKALEDQLSTGDYDLNAGTGTFDTNSTQAEIDALMEEWNKELEDALDNMPNPFDGLKKKWDEVKDWFKRNASIEGLSNIGGEIWGWLQRNLSVEGLSNIWRPIDEWFSNIDLPDPGPTLQRWADSVGDFFINFFEGDHSLVDVGESIIDGIMEGIQGALRGLYDLAIDLCEDWIINPIKKALGIASPSKVMMGVGKDIVQGLVDGVKAIASTVWDAFMVIVGWLKPIWEPIVNATKRAWDIISGAVSDAWNKFIYPVFAAIWSWLTAILTPVFTFFMNVIRVVWAVISSVIRFAWERVIKPVFDAVWNFIKTKIIPIFQTLWAVVQIIWTWIGTKIKAVWDTIIRPALEALRSFISDKIVGAWNGLFATVVSVWDGIKAVVKSGAESMANFVVKGVNAALGAFRWLSDGIKSLGAKIGVTIDIPDINDLNTVKLAKGGIPPTDANGGLYAGVRAIVGEGSNVWPEFVIPTDPKYRDRARMLAQAAAERVGLFAQGGTVGAGSEDTGIWDQIKRGAQTALEGAKDLSLTAMFAPIKAAMNRMADLIPMEIIRGMAKFPIKMVEEWIKGAGGDTSILEGWKGKNGSYEAILRYFQSTGIPGVAGSTIRPGATTRGSGNTRASLHASARAVDFFTRPASVDSDGLLAIYRAFLPVKDILTELIYSGPGGSNPRNPITAADHHNHVHVGLARGGMLDAQRVYNFANGGTFKIPHGGGGILARIGEGSNDERAQIIPLNDAQKGGGGGDTIIEINGDLSFPNITSGDDADKLIENLKALAS